MEEKEPWVAVESVCKLYGVTYATAKNQILYGRFPVPTYKVGKIHVIDRAVHERFFAEKRAAGLQALESTKG